MVKAKSLLIGNLRNSFTEFVNTTITHYNEEDYYVSKFAYHFYKFFKKFVELEKIDYNEFLSKYRKIIKNDNCVLFSYKLAQYLSAHIFNFLSRVLQIYLEKVSLLYEEKIPVKKLKNNFSNDKSDKLEVLFSYYDVYDYIPKLLNNNFDISRLPKSFRYIIDYVDIVRNFINSKDGFLIKYYSYFENLKYKDKHYSVSVFANFDTLLFLEIMRLFFDPMILWKDFCFYNFSNMPSNYELHKKFYEENNLFNILLKHLVYYFNKKDKDFVKQIYSELIKFRNQLIIILKFFNKLVIEEGFNRFTFVIYNKTFGIEDIQGFISRTITKIKRELKKERLIGELFYVSQFAFSQITMMPIYIVHFCVKKEHSNIETEKIIERIKSIFDIERKNNDLDLLFGITNIDAIYNRNKVKKMIFPLPYFNDKCIFDNYIKLHPRVYMPMFLSDYFVYNYTYFYELPIFITYKKIDYIEFNDFLVKSRNLSKFLNGILNHNFFVKERNSVLFLNMNRIKSIEKENNNEKNNKLDNFVINLNNDVCKKLVIDRYLDLTQVDENKYITKNYYLLSFYSDDNCHNNNFSILVEKSEDLKIFLPYLYNMFYSCYDISLFVEFKEKLIKLYFKDNAFRMFFYKINKNKIGKFIDFLFDSNYDYYLYLFILFSPKHSKSFFTKIFKKFLKENYKEIFCNYYDNLQKQRFFYNLFLAKKMQKVRSLFTYDNKFFKDKMFSINICHVKDFERHLLSFINSLKQKMKDDFINKLKKEEYYANLPKDSNDL